MGGLLTKNCACELEGLEQDSANDTHLPMLFLPKMNMSLPESSSKPCNYEANWAACGGRPLMKSWVAVATDPF